MKKIAIIGAGNMGSAIAGSLRGADYEIAITAATEKSRARTAERFPEAKVCADNREAVSGADIVVLCVKPYAAAAVMGEIASVVKPGAIFISVVAAMTLADLKELLSPRKGCVYFFRVIPNTAIAVGKSATFIVADSDATPEAVATVTAIFDRSGKTFLVEEKQMGALTSISSCGIAYILRFIRAAAEGGVEIGLKPQFAAEVVAATADGAAALVEAGAHPEAEIDKVTTPGGLTIKGLNTLEEKGFTAAVIAAVKASNA